jgi:hypothetical protein
MIAFLKSGDTPGRAKGLMALTLWHKHSCLCAFFAEAAQPLHVRDGRNRGWASTGHTQERLCH